MTAAWPVEELERIGAADDLQMAPLRVDGAPRRPVRIWVVRAGGEQHR